MNKFIFHTAAKYRLSRHLGFFVLVVLIFSLVLFSRSQEHNFGRLLFITFTNALFFLGYGYLTIFILLPSFLPERKYIHLGISFLALGLLLSVAKLYFSDFIFYSSISPEYLSSRGLVNLRFILINTKDMTFIVALLVITKFTKDWLIAENQYKSLQKAFEELNVRILQSHFEPHFLFNTLNNLYALSLRDKVDMVDSIQRFRRVLQFSIKEAQLTKVRVSDELAMISDFVQLEQLRYDAGLQFYQSVSGNFENVFVAPLLLFTLVENCFEHNGSANEPFPFISISLSCMDEKLSFETRTNLRNATNCQDEIQQKELRSLQQRLELLYPMKFSLSFSSGFHETAVKLELILK